MRALGPTIAVLVGLSILFAIFTGFWTERLWYNALDFGTVFTTTLLTRVGMFVVFGSVMALAVLASLWVAYRVRPRYRAMSPEQQALDRYRERIDPRHRLIAVSLSVLIGVIAGWTASGYWATYLQWRHQTAFGIQDPQFGLDASFYLFDYPWYRFLIGFGFAVVVLALLVAVVAHYLYGGIRLQTQGQRASGAAQAHISLLLGLFVLLKGVAYWLDRYGLALGSHVVSTRQPFTGITYSDAHAVLPAKTILTFIAIICAILFFVNVFRRTWLLPGLGAGLLVLSAVLLGWAWPSLVQAIQVRPSEPDYERPYIQRNIDATRHAFGISNTKVIPFKADVNPDEEQLATDESSLPGVRLIDPSVVQETYTQEKQLRGYYSFSNPLDVDRYRINGESQDAVLAVREIDLEGLADDQRNWTNDHTVYTHGFGLVGAYGNRRTPEGVPEWLTEKELGRYEPRVYYGENSPEYSIVGAPEGAEPVELDAPSEDRSDERTYTYQGKGGVPVGSFFHKILYASKFSDVNILLSGRVNSESKIMYDRNPRERVQKVAPWLTLDSDPYPAVVNGRIKWIVDGYTVSDQYPLSQRFDLTDATSDSLTQQPSIAGQPSVEVNYMRNSVKAVVDAYDGTVDLYAWDENDPVLQTWRKVYPGTVKDRDQMPEALVDHVRYPEDLMKVQREVLGRYHVTNAETFYQGSERWRIPSDPTNQNAKQPVYYLSVRMPDQEEPVFSLTSTYIHFNRQNLAAFAAVNADPRSGDYGQIRILQLDEGVQIDGPNQIANQFDSDTKVADALLPLTRGDAEAIKGNLLTLPIGGGLLYVQPVYVQRAGDASYPLLRLVLASSGGKVGVGSTLEEALSEVYEAEDVETGEQPDEDQSGEDQETEEPPSDGEEQQPSQTVAELLAEANAAFDRAEAALRQGDLAGYQRWTKEAQAAVAAALQAQEGEGAQGDESQDGRSRGDGTQGSEGERDSGTQEGAAQGEGDSPPGGGG